MYRMQKTAQIELQLPVLLEYVRIMSKRNRDYIPQPVASAETILYAIQEELIWFKDKTTDQEAAIGFVRLLMAFPCERVAIENPIGVISSKIRKPDQIIQPWQFGHGETKATCLWLKGLPKLQPTNIVEGRKPRVHHEPPSPERWKNRSRTLPGIAEAMAEQWGSL